MALEEVLMKIFQIKKAPVSPEKIPKAGKRKISYEISIGQLKKVETNTMARSE